MVSCRNCKHFRRETESWEMPDYYWFVCRAIPGMANLKSFPFANTRCKKFEPAEIVVPKSLDEMLHDARTRQK